MDISERPAMSNPLGFDDFLTGSPVPPAMDESTFRRLGILDLPSLADVEEHGKGPLRQDSSLQSVTSEDCVPERVPELRDLLYPEMGAQNDSTSATYIHPLDLQQSGTRPVRPNSFASLGRTHLPVDRHYGTVRLPPLALSSGVAQPVPPNSSYDASHLPSLHPPFGRIPSVPPNDPFNRLTPGALRSASFLHLHPISSHIQQRGAYYPHQPQLSVPSYDQVEDLALDPNERSDHLTTAPHAEAERFALSPIEISSSSPTPTATSSGTVEMDLTPSQSPGRGGYHPSPCHCECHEVNSSTSTQADKAESILQRATLTYKQKTQPSEDHVTGPVTIKLVETNWPRCQKLAAAAATTEANARTSGYVPRQRRLTERARERDLRLARERYEKKKQQRLQQDPVKGPLKLELVRTKGKKSPSLAAAKATAEANIGKSGYVPRQQQLSGTAWPRHNLPVNGPIKVVLNNAQTAGGRNLVAEANSSSYQDTNRQIPTPAEADNYGENGRGQSRKRPHGLDISEDSDGPPERPQVRNRRLGLRSSRKVGEGKPPSAN